MSITDSFLKEDVKKYYGSANKLPLPVWLDILGLTGRGADNSYRITTRLIENHGLGLYTEDDALLNASIDDRSYALTGHKSLEWTAPLVLKKPFDLDKKLRFN
jgi:hypothetical protein